MLFTYESAPLRVRFSPGRAAEHLAEEVECLEVTRAVLITSNREHPRASRLVDPLGSHVAGAFTAVKQHVPAPTAADAVRYCRELGADGLISVGGGSATGTAKAVARETGLPIVAVPTTFAGSEVTPVWGITTAGRKETGVDPRVRPAAVVYDPDLVAGLPADIAVPSALNALAHCVEAYWTPRTNPVTAALATEGVGAIARGLRAAAQAPGGGAESLLYGAFVAGLCFAAAGSGLHHKLCHVLGGAFDLPHAPLHAVILPHVLEFNSDCVPLAAERIATALGSRTAVDGLAELYRLAGAPTRLRDIGLDEPDLSRAADLAAALPIDNPRPVTRDGIARILTAAYGR